MEQIETLNLINGNERYFENLADVRSKLPKNQRTGPERRAGKLSAGI